MKRRTQSIVLVLCMLLSLLPVQAEAASAPKLSKDELTLNGTGTARTVTVKNVKASRVKSLKATSSDRTVADATVLSKTKLRVTSRFFAGDVTVTVKLALKKKIRNKKKYTFKLIVHATPDIPHPTPSAEPTASVAPTASPSVKPSSTPAPTATPKPSASATPTATATPTPTATATASPTASPTVSPSVSPGGNPTLIPPTNLTEKEMEVYNRIVAKMADYPQGMYWTDEIEITWYARFYEYIDQNQYFTVTARGCVALACLLSDAAFGECKLVSEYPPKVDMIAPARQIDNPDPSTIRVGDIIRFKNNSHSAIVIGTEGDVFTIAEGNYNRSVNWGRTIPKTTRIDFVWTRW